MNTPKLILAECRNWFEDVHRTEIQIAAKESKTTLLLYNYYVLSFFIIRFLIYHFNQWSQ